MKFLSLFSGIEAASEAWEPLDWEAAAFCEWDKFPSEVLNQRHPEVPNFGDVSKITEQDIAGLGRIDLVVFGSPCQDLSVAGKGKGFNGDRSSLFRDAIRVIQWARKHCGTRFALWENVPGAFSSNKGRDFAEVVSTMAGLEDVTPPPNGWGKEGAAVGDNGLLEWAILDAQWFGLAQRRKRVFAIVDFGDWISRPPILLERESLRGDTPPSRETREEFAADAGTSTSPSSDEVLVGAISSQKDGSLPHEPIGTLTSGSVSGGGEPLPAVAFAQNQRNEVRVMNISGALAAQPGINQQTFVCTSGSHWDDPEKPHPTLNQSHNTGGIGSSNQEIFAQRGGGLVLAKSNSVMAFSAGNSSKARSIGLSFEHTPPLRAANSGTNQVPTVTYSIKSTAIGRKPENGGNGLGIEKETSPTLTGQDRHAVAHSMLAFGEYCSDETASTMKARDYKDATDLVVGDNYVVRRLTPTECARLQGFPDNHARIEWKGKPAEQCPDGHQYKAYGNSMAVPVMRWIGEKIDEAVCL